jgi:hypothetical protein
MARTENVPPTDDGRNDENDQRPTDDNGVDGRGDAHELEDSSGDIDFDPAKLEADEPATPPSRDLFDPAFLGLSQDFAAEANVAKKWDVIKVEKPTKARVFRVHPTMRVKTTLLVLKEDNESYLIHPRLRQALAGESLCGTFTLLTCMTRAGTPFVWPIRMADGDGKWNIWHQSGWQIAEKAQVRWARMYANRDAGHYVAEYDQRPPEQQQAPAWPDLQFRDWLELAFRGYTIESLDHPILKRLRLED